MTLPRPEDHPHDTSETNVVLLIDDLRSFVDGRAAEVARTSAEGVALLARHRDQRIDELWLDHDLGGDDMIWPVVEALELAAFEERPFDIGVILIHSANPSGAAKMSQALRRWGYPVRPATGSPAVGYSVTEARQARRKRQDRARKGGSPGDRGDAGTHEKARPRTKSEDHPVTGVT